MANIFKKHKLITISFLLGFIFFTLAIFSFDFEKVFNNFEKISVSKFILYFLIANLTFVLGVWRWKVILKSYSISINFSKLYLWRLAGWTANYLTPSAYLGGEPLKALFISKEAQIDFKPALANVLADSFLNVFTELALTCFAAFFAILHFSRFLKFEESFFVAVILIIVAVYYLYWRISKGMFILSPVLKLFRVHRWKPKIFFEVWEFEKLFIDFFKNKKKALRKSLLISILMYLSSLVEFWILAYFLGVNFSLWHTILFKVFIVLGYILPIPAGIGTAEISLAKFFEIFGWEASLGVAYSLLIRLKDIILAVLGFIVLSSYGIGFLKPAFTLLKNFIKENWQKLGEIDFNNKKG
jgi:uncharacterized protein (TIRG00374 family)